MQAVSICPGDDHGNVESSSSISRTINIASVRAASLRTCGLRAAARAASSRGMSFSPQTSFSPTMSRVSSTNLSYTNSQEPGEESQKNASAMVEKLIDLNAGLLWQTPETSTAAAEQSCVKGAQSIKGLQWLARSADMKNQQGKLGIFDWNDSQTDDAEKDVSTISGQSKKCEHINGQREDCQATMSDMAIVKDLSITLYMAGGVCSKEQGSLECHSICARSALKEGSKVFEVSLSNSRKMAGVEHMMENELRDVDANVDREEAEFMDISANTQVALEAMDIMRHGALSSPCDRRETYPAFDIGNDTQSALDAMDILKSGREPYLVSSEGERQEDTEGSRHQKLEQVVQMNEYSLPIPEGKKRGSPSRSPTYSKPVDKEEFSTGASKTTKQVGKTPPLKPSDPALFINKRFLLDFSSAMVPRRKRSRLSFPRVSLNENIDALGWQKSGPPLYDLHQEADKQGKAKERQSLLLTSNCVELPVLTESTNGRGIKRERSTKPDWDMLLQQSRKRRKCEPRSVFVLFSHSLSDSAIKHQKKMLKKLGGHVASSAANATHFVADSFVRSKNMLEIMAAGKLVVTTNWLEGCSQAEYFVEEESYILKDAQKEREWGFCMHSSLATSRRRPLLKGMKVVVSPNTVPDFTAMKGIIESAGGQVLQKPSVHEIVSIAFVVASEEDHDFCAEYIRKGHTIYSTELILHGVVVQSLDLLRNRLFVG